MEQNNFIWSTVLMQKRLHTLMFVLVTLVSLASKASAELQLEQNLQTITALLTQYSETRTRRVDDVSDMKYRLYELKQQLIYLSDTVQAEFAEVEQTLKESALPDVFWERHYQALSDYQTRLNTLLENLEAIGNTEETHALATKVVDTLNYLHSFQPPHQPAFDPEQLPFAIAKPELLNETATSANQVAENTRRVRSNEETNYLVETEDVQITEDIRTLAQTLNYQPVSIFNWVHDNIEFIPSHGSIQGSQMTLDMKRGNAFDTTSLLIALLRASNIEARYVYGTVQIPTEKVMNWLQADTPEMAIDLLSKAAIPHSTLISGGVIKAIKIDHIWVEAWVDFIPSRGAKHRQGDSWVPLDAAFKQHQTMPSIDLQQEIPFDAQGLIEHWKQTVNINEDEGWIADIDQTYMQTALQNYQTQVENYLAQAHPDAETIFETHSILPTNRPVLAASLPYHLVARKEIFATLPAKFRHTLTVALFANENAKRFGDSLLSATLSLPKLQSQRLHLTYVPATEEDAQALEYYSNLSGATELPLYLFQLKPVLMLEDTVLAEGNAVTMGQTQIYTLTLTDTRQSYAQPGTVHAGDETVFTVNGNGLTFDFVKNRMLAFKDSVDVAENLHLLGLLFWFEHDWLDDLAAKAYHVRVQRVPSVGAFFMPLTIRYYFGIPKSGYYHTRKVDVRRNAQILAGGTPQSRFNFMSHIGIHGSYLEGSVLDQLFGQTWMPGRSTTQVLIEAVEQNIPIYTVTQDNMHTVLPQLSLTEDVRQEITNAVNVGKVVIIPQRDVNQGNWTGTGYIVQDPITGEGAYLIDGGYNGGSWEGCEIVEVGKGYTFDHQFMTQKRRLFEKFEKEQKQLERQLAEALEATKQIQDHIQRLKKIDQINQYYNLLFDFNAKVFVMGLAAIGGEILVEGDNCFVARAKSSSDGIYVKDKIHVVLSPIDEQYPDSQEATVLFTADSVTSCSGHLWSFEDENEESFGSTDGSTELHPSYSYTSPGLYVVTVTATCLGQESIQTSQIEVQVDRLVVDLIVEGISDEIEETQGGFIQWNLDRDENNTITSQEGYKLYVRDFEEDQYAGSRIVKEDDELLMALLKVEPEGIQGSWQLTFPEKVKVFEEKPDGTIVELASAKPSSIIKVSTDNVVAKLYIEAVDQSELEKDITLNAIFKPEYSEDFPIKSTFSEEDTVKLTSIVGDLTVSEIRPIQVIEDVPLVKDKATVARVFVEWSSPLSQLSDGAYLEGITVKLEGIPEGSLTSLPAVAQQYEQETYFFEKGEQHYGYHSFMEFNKQMLDMFEYRGQKSAIVISKFFPDSVGQVTYKATVDPEDTLFEKDELNNQHVVEGIEVKPFIYEKYKIFWQYVRGENDSPFDVQIENVAFPSHNYFRSVYPIPEKDIVHHYHKEEIQVESLSSNISTWLFAYNLSDDVKERGYNLGSYIAPDGSLGSGMYGSRPNFIDNVVFIIENAYDHTFAHEVGHTFGFCEEYERRFGTECYLLDWPDDYEWGYVAANGWNAEWDDSFKLNNQPRISVYPSDPTHRPFNLFSFMSNDSDTKKNWITRVNYLTLMDNLIEGGSQVRKRERFVHVGGKRKEKPTVRIMGLLHEDETFEFHKVIPGMGYDSRTRPGKFAIEWLDIKDQLLHRLSFGQGYQRSYVDWNGKKVLPISLEIEEPEGAYRLRIVKEDKELFGLNRTPNAPQIQLGELQHISEKEILVTAEISDKDGDQCRTILLYGANRSGPWAILGKSSDMGHLEFRFDPNNPDLPASKTGILRVRTCDGLNCTNAEIPFTDIEDKPPSLSVYHKEEVYDELASRVRKKKVISHYSYRIGAYDLEDNDIGEKVQWFDSQGNLVGTGESFSSKVKIKGLTAKVSDSNGQEVELKVEE